MQMSIEIVLNLRIGWTLNTCTGSYTWYMYISSLVTSPHVLPSEKQSGEQSQISWAYSPKCWKTNEIVRSLIIM